MNIVKYKNRKLYSTTDSQYVTLDTVAQYVRLGGTVKATCSYTKLDITDQVLAAAVVNNLITRPPSVETSLKMLRST